MALSRSVWLAGSKYLRLGVSLNNGCLLRRAVVIKPQYCLALRSVFYKSPGTTMDALRIWKLLRFLGMDYCKIVRIRRKMMKFSYPWLTYCLPAAMILAMGDFIAQYHLKPHAADRTFYKFLTEEWLWHETLLFAIVGFLPVGFMLSRWNLSIYRRLKCHGRFKFLLTKLLLDLFILSPLILGLIAIVYSNFYDRNMLKESRETVKKMFEEKIWPAVKESMVFNMETRPLALFGIYFLAPLHLRRLFKTVYEVIFATFVTNSIRENVHHGSGSSHKGSHHNGGNHHHGVDHTSNAQYKNANAESLVERPLGRWARYKRWACRNREDD